MLSNARITLPHLLQLWHHTHSVKAGILPACVSCFVSRYLSLSTPAQRAAASMASGTDAAPEFDLVTIGAGTSAASSPLLLITLSTHLGRCPKHLIQTYDVSQTWNGQQ